MDSVISVKLSPGPYLGFFFTIRDMKASFLNTSSFFRRFLLSEFYFAAYDLGDISAMPMVLTTLLNPTNSTFKFIHWLSCIISLYMLMLPIR